LPAAPFTCGGTLTDIRDNKTYPTVQIGTQCWMAANLNHGTSITSTQMQRDNCVNEKYCYFDTPSACDTRGGLYQWDEMMQYNPAADGKGICPPAWHVPSENEWNTLFLNYIDEGFAGNPLKGTGYSGFNGWLFGDRFDNMKWDFENFATILWSSTSRGNYKAWAHGMNEPDPSVSTYPANRAHAFSVRCIKD
ncbi:MAG: FISUMP domain-containing protein, partial [Syntrophothermus sp.]